MLFDELRDNLPAANFALPYQITFWLLDGLFAAEDARNGQPERLAHTEAMLARLRALREGTGSSSTDPAIALLEAQLARAAGDIDRASGLFGRAAREARLRELNPVVAYAHEERARD